MATTAKFFAIIPCGGTGQRFGGSTPKQYLKLGTRTVLEHSAQAMLADPRIETVFVVVPPEDTHAAVLFENCPKIQVLPLAGTQRSNTVLNALNHLLAQFKVAETDWVLVHDAARPGLQAHALTALMDAASEHVAGGLLAMPLADTLKSTVVAEDSTVISQHTVPRQGLWAAQTPQMFRAQALSLAMTECMYKGLVLTDEANAIETMGIGPLIVPGHIENLKITYPSDFNTLVKLLGFAPEELPCNRP